ncbi:hypothetical protein GCM10023213_25750 [Prosthecobacter algae]|uniref:Uncharacterized protein n=1 Tax=Prosthecobacter algae TaxID=1144682 RepID=A0ABP9P6B4_9BACT
MLSPSRWTVALLTWLPLFIVTILGSSWGAARITHAWTQGMDYYRSQHPVQDAGWTALLIAAIASILFIVILPFRLRDPLRETRLWQTSTLVALGQMAILVLSGLLAISLTFHSGIPTHGRIPPLGREPGPQSLQWTPRQSNVR